MADAFAILVQPCSQAEAEAGSDNIKPMTPLRTKQAFEGRDQIAAPQSGIAAVVLDEAGNLTGAKYYAVTFVDANGGETEPTAELNRPGATPTAQKITVTLPLGGTGTVARKLYRGDAYVAKLVATIADNTTTTYVDNIADGSLGVDAPQVNTTGGMLCYVNDVRVANADQGSTNFGWQTGVSNYGFHNSNFGYRAGKSQLQNYWNSNFGAYAGEMAATGYETCNFGYKAGQSATSSIYTVNIGVLAGFTATTSNQTVNVGYAACGSATSTSSSVHVGHRAGGEILADLQNTTLGAQAGTFLANGSTELTQAENCLYLGYDSRASADGINNEIAIGPSAIGSGTGTTTIGKQNQTLTRAFGSFDVRCEGDAEMTFRRINSSNVVQTQLRIANPTADTNFYFQTTASNINWLKVAADGKLEMYQEITLAGSTWHKSADTLSRFHFENNGRTYLWGHGTTPFDFRDANFDQVLVISATSTSMRIASAFRELSVGDADSGGTGYRLVRVPN